MMKSTSPRDRRSKEDQTDGDSVTVQEKLPSRAPDVSPSSSPHEDNGFVEAALALILAHPLDRFEPETEVPEDRGQDFVAGQRRLVEFVVRSRGENDALSGLRAVTSLDTQVPLRRTLGLSNDAPWVLRAAATADVRVERSLAVNRPILVSAGPASCSIIHKYWQRAVKKQVIIDVGSAIDKRTNRRVRRQHQMPGTRRAELVCTW